MRHADDIISLVPYRVPMVRACVMEAKFKDNMKAQSLLAGILADYLREDMLEDPLPCILIPIPLSPARQRERGYNQAERIAQGVVALLPNACVDTTILVRTRDTLPQTTLSRKDRATNVAGAFHAAGPLDQDYTYIVVDDVLTTGATLRAAIEAIRNTGALRVSGLALAH